MAEVRGLLGLAVLLLVAVAVSRHRRGISWRTVGVALALQVSFAVLVLRWGPGERALGWVSDRVETLIGYAEEGTAFVFGPLLGVGEEGETIFALQVLPVIVFLGALIGLLFYLRVIQWATYVIGGALARLLGVSKVESMYASTVIFLGQSEAPLMIAPYLRSLRRGQLFTIMSAGFAAAAGSTLVGYSLLGAPLEYLLAATVMNAPAALLMAKIMWPDSTPEDDDERPRDQAGERRAGRGARRPLGPRRGVAQRDRRDRSGRDGRRQDRGHGGRAADRVRGPDRARQRHPRCGGGWFGADGLTFEKLLGWAVAPLAWLLGVPWSEAVEAGSWIGQKTVLNEFVAYADFGPAVDGLSPVTVAVVTFALAGFANLTSIAIQIGTIGSLLPERRSEVAQLGLRALLAGSLANLANAAIAGVVIGF